MMNRLIENIVYTTLLILIQLAGFQAHAQEDAIAKYRSIMEEGIDLMAQGKYEDADRKFKLVLRNMEVLPTDISYYFGKNSYYLELYKQSINWLNKYIELKGTNGRFFEESVEFLNRAEMAYKLENEKNSEKVLQELSRNNEFDCQGREFFQCPLCKGEGVLLKPGKMNNIIYQTCPYCEGNGRITCEDYKLYLRGELSVID